MRVNLKHYYISFVLLILLLTANFFLWQISRSYVSNSARATFNERVLSYSKDVRDDLREYMDLPIYGSAMIDNIPNVSRKEFQSYFTDIISHRKEVYVAVKGMVFVENVTDQKLFIEKVRGDKSIVDVGYPFFNIFPPTTENTIFAINYIAPFEENKSLFGYDLATDPKQLEIMRQAIITRNPLATESLIVLNSNRITVYSPIFTTNNNKQELKGFIAMILDPDILFEQMADTHNSGIVADVYNGKKDTIPSTKRLYESDDANPKFQSMQYVELAKQPFTIVYSSTESAQQSLLQRIVPQFLLYGGSGIIFLLFMTVNYMFFSKTSPESEKTWTGTKTK